VPSPGPREKKRHDVEESKGNQTPHPQRTPHAARVALAPGTGARYSDCGMDTFAPPDLDRIAAFCRRWQIRDLSLFGSALRDDFGPASDVDLLVTFEDGARWSLLDHATMEAELGALFGRRVDLVTRAAVERSANWLRRRAILQSARPLHVAQG